MAFPSIKIQIGADTSRLRKDLKKGEGLVSSFGKVAGNAMLGVAAAATTAAIKIGVDGVKAAIEDEAAAAKLAKTLQNVTHATDSQVKSVEDYITKTTLATGITDDQLRPSLDRLVRSTHDVTKAQQLQKIALDVSAGTGKDLQAVTNAIAKAYDGNFGALKRLGVTVDAATMKSKDFNRVQEVLQKTFGGQMNTSLKTHEGQLRLLTTRWAEMKEEIGYVLLDGMKPLMDWVNGAEGQKFMKDFMLAFKDAAISLAKQLPTILENLKKVGKVAGGLGISWDSFSDPKLVAAAAAFRMAPGGLQGKVIAALIAYGVSAAMGAQDDPNFQRQQKAAFGLNQLAMSGTSKQYKAEQSKIFTGTFSEFAQRVYYGTGASLDELTKGSRYATAVNIVVNGATDPAATAKAVSRSLNKAQRMGLNTAAIGAGS